MKSSKPTGSFGIPEEMIREINKSKMKAASSVESEPVKEAEYIMDAEDPRLGELSEETIEEFPKGNLDKKAALTEKEDMEAKIKELMQEIREDLKIEITEDDMWSLLFSDELVKRNVTIIPGKMMATFRTLSMNDTNEVDSKMAETMEESHLDSGYKNINTQLILARSIVELGKPGKLRSLGETVDERFAALGKMSALVLEKLSAKWNQFVFLVDETLKSEADIKKP